MAGMNLLSSKDRLMLAINHEEADHVPLWINFLWSSQNQDRFSPERWSLFFATGDWPNQFERAKELLDLGIDDMLTLSPPPPRLHSNVRVKITQEDLPTEPYPLLAKEYNTPKGILRTVVRKTEDWSHGDDVPLFSDLSIPRAKKHLISEAADLDKLLYLLQPSSSDTMESFRKKAKEMKEFSEKHGVLMVGEGGILGDGAAWVCGVQDHMFALMDKPKFIEDLLSIFQGFDMRRIQMLLDVGVDVVVHRGWYESPKFWSPKLYRKFILPLIHEQVKVVHQGGAKFGYIMTTGVMSLLNEFLELDIDLLIHVDPVQDNVDLHQLKQKIGDDICIVGGVNSYLTVERGTNQEIEQAVTEAIRALAPGGGFILEPVDGIQMERKKIWDRLMVMIDTWRQVGTYR